MLQAELEAHDDARGAALGRRRMRPLARAFEARFLGWLPKATYPVRVGTHGSSAFALVARRIATRPFAADPGFGAALRDAARRWFEADADVRPLEPSGSDFLSPTLIDGRVHAADPARPDDFARLVRPLPAAPGRRRAGGAVRARDRQRPRATARSPTSTD